MFKFYTGDQNAVPACLKVGWLCKRRIWKRLTTFITQVKAQKKKEQIAILFSVQKVQKDFMMVLAKRIFQKRRLKVISSAIQESQKQKKKVQFLQALSTAYQQNQITNFYQRKKLLRKGFQGLRHRVEYN
jgi:hypothetical protein